MKGKLKTINVMVMGLLQQKVINMRDTGKIIKKTVKELYFILMELNILVIG